MGVIPEIHPLRKAGSTYLPVQASGKVHMWAGWVNLRDGAGKAREIETIVVKNLPITGLRYLGTILLGARENGSPGKKGGNHPLCRGKCGCWVHLND